VKNNIILIGFMGVGKGTIARAYSHHSNRYNIDTDDLIESKENKTIKKIFTKEGEAFFRALEQDTANWIEESVDNTIISCGGGFYNVDNIDKLGIIVLLNASYEWIYNRLSTAPNAKNKLAKRPLFANPKEAQKLYKSRQEDYRKVADVIIDIENRSMEEIFKEIDSI